MCAGPEYADIRMRPSGAGGEPRPPECFVFVGGRWSDLTVCGVCGSEHAYSLLLSGCCSKKFF